MLSEKLKVLRNSIVIPFVDFKPISKVDSLKILINSLFYNLEALKRIFLIKFNLKTSWHKEGNLRVPLSCKVLTKYKEIPLVFELRSNSDDMYFLKPKYEEKYLDFFYPKKGDVVLDVGSHVGKYTIYAGKLVGKKGKVIAIEANPYNYQQLLRNIKLNNLDDIVKAYNIAASDVNGIVELRMPKDFGRSTIINNRTIFEKERIKIKSIRLENLLIDNSIEYVDWAKIDVEGSEIKVLAGMGCFLNRVNKILIEVSNENRFIFQKIMDKHGFKVEAVFKEKDQSYYFVSKNS